MFANFHVCTFTINTMYLTTHLRLWQHPYPYPHPHPYTHPGLHVTTVKKRFQINYITVIFYLANVEKVSALSCRQRLHKKGGKHENSEPLVVKKPNMRVKFIYIIYPCQTSLGGIWRAGYQQIEIVCVTKVRKRAMCWAIAFTYERHNVTLRNFQTRVALIHKFLCIYLLCR